MPTASQLPRWLRDPLVAFALGGVALFVLHARCSPASPEDAEDAPVRAATEPDEEIRISGADRAAMGQSFARRMGRPPTDDEMDALEHTWVDERLLVAQGRALGLDRGDPVIRDRVIARTRARLTEDDDRPAADSSQGDAAPPEAQLRAFYDEHRDRYTEGVRFDFEQVYLSGRAPDAPARVSAAVDQLRAGTDPREVGGRFSAGKRFTLGRLASTFGRTFAEGVSDVELDTWTEVEVSSGVHLVRITRRTDGETVLPFSRVRRQVARDWRAAKKAAAVDEALARLRPTFDVHWRVEAPTK